MKARLGQYYYAPLRNYWGSMAVDFRIGNRGDGNQSDRVFRQGRGTRVCMEDEWLGQTFKEVKLV